MTPLRHYRLDTDIGSLRVGFSPAGLAEVVLPGRRRPPDPELRDQEGDIGRQVARVLRDYAAGRGLPADAAEIPLDLSRGTAFQQNVWKAMLAIPFGQTRTYGQIAAAVGKPGAARAVGGACHANPLPVLVPCHRVVAAGGKLGGFGGGLELKKRLLALEDLP
jgi:methylated-DNA-[protein]-cysteine S-methyltransferase